MKKMLNLILLSSSIAFATTPVQHKLQPIAKPASLVVKNEIGASANGSKSSATQSYLERKVNAIKALGAFLAKPTPVLTDKRANVKQGGTQSSFSKCHECDNATLIFASDINPSGYLITTPGTYCLAEDVVFNPASNDLSAIVIDADNVTLHLRNKKLSATGSATGTVGILVNGRSNVSIDHGSLSSFNLFGVRLNPGSSFVTLDHLCITGCGNTSTFCGGIAISSDSSLLSHDINLNYVNSSRNFWVGLVVATVDRMTVTNSHFNENIGIVEPAFGETTWGAFLIPSALAFPNPAAVACSNVDFVNCELNKNTSFGGAIGFEIVSIPAFGLPSHFNVNILNSEANNNKGGGNTTFGQVNEGEGFVIAGTQNFVVENCLAEGNSSLATTPSGTPGFNASTGFGVPFFGVNGRFVNCVAKNNSGGGDVSTGFRVFGSDSITISHCCAFGNNNTSNGEAWGFTTDPNFGSFVSFGPAVSTNLLLDYNKAQNNNSASGLSGGFKFVSLTGSVLSHNKSSCNAIGILVTDGCSEGCSSSNNVIAYNKVTKNTQAGIVDQIPGAGTLYFGNTSRANGAAGAENYVGDIFPQPVTCPKAKNCVPANKTPIRLVVDGDACKVNTNCERRNKTENVDVRP